MSSIYNRAAWIVAVLKEPSAGGRFSTESTAREQAERLSAAGHAGVTCKQDRKERWEVRVRLKGRTQVKTFDNKTDAKAWATERESEVIKGQVVDHRVAERNTLGDVLAHYASDVLTDADTSNPDKCRIRMLLKHSVSSVSMAALTPKHIDDYKRERLKVVKGTTVKKELELIARVINSARIRMNLEIWRNVASGTYVARPEETEDDERDRRFAATHRSPEAHQVAFNLAKLSGNKRLAQHRARLAKMEKAGDYFVYSPRITRILQVPVGERAALLRACRYPLWFRPLLHSAVLQGAEHPPSEGKFHQRRGCRIWAIVSFAMSTAMRRGEISKLQWEHVDLEAGSMTLPAKITKNGQSRLVPLDLRARRILATQPGRRGLVFKTTVEIIERQFEQAMIRCGIDDYRFHDLRHEATSLLFEETTLRDSEIGSITGHLDPRMLRRYNNRDKEKFVAKFRASRRKPGEGAGPATT